MSLIKAKDQLILVPMYYVEKNMGDYSKIAILEEEKALQMIEDEKKPTPEPEKKPNTPPTPAQDTKKVKMKVQCLKTYWKMIGWKEQNQIAKMSQVQSLTGGSPDIDMIKLRDLRIKTCLKKWDLKDDDGKDVSVSVDTIDAMPADVIYYLDSQYAQKISLTEEEVKNL